MHCKPAYAKSEVAVYLGLRQGVASPSGVEPLSDAILLCAVRPYHSFHFVQCCIATVGAEQAPRLLQSSVSTGLVQASCLEAGRLAEQCSHYASVHVHA